MYNSDPKGWADHLFWYLVNHWLVKTQEHSLEVKLLCKPSHLPFPHKIPKLNICTFILHGKILYHPSDTWCPQQHYRVRVTITTFMYLSCNFGILALKPAQGDYLSFLHCYSRFTLEFPFECYACINSNKGIQWHKISLFAIFPNPPVLSAKSPGNFEGSS